MPPSPPETPAPAGPSRRAWALWTALAAAWWTLDGFTTATNYYRMGQASGAITWDHALRAGLGGAWLWVPATLLAVWLAQRYTLDRNDWARYLPIHLGAAVGVCVARAGAVVVLNPWAGWYRALPPFGEVVLTSFANNFFLFGMLVGVGHAAAYARRARERDEQLARAELAALKAQLHPHFLFNALNAVNAYVRADPDVAERMIARLSELLRHALLRPGTHEVPLSEELRVARAYLDIEQVRFEDRLRVRWEVDPAAHEASVPHLILQPLVENAVRHGIAPRAAGGAVEITAERRNGTLHLSVRDDGVGLPPDVAEGVGLANTRARLRQLYGERQRMEVAPAEGGGVHVRLAMPFRQQAG